MATYVDNKEFNKLLISYKKDNDRDVYNKIGKIFILIAENLLNRTNFINYTFDRKQEMISDATYFMVRYMDRYKTYKKNPFSYFTRIAFNAFLQYINEHKKHDEMFKPIEYIENFENNPDFIIGIIEYD